MATNVRFYEVITSALSTLLNKQFGIESGNDADLGFPMAGYKDNAGNTNKFLCKNKPAKTTTISCSSITATGDITTTAKIGVNKTPSANLDVNGSIAATSSIEAGGVIISNLSIRATPANGNQFDAFGDDQDIVRILPNGADSLLQANCATKRIGVNTSLPSAALDVKGNISEPIAAFRDFGGSARVAISDNDITGDRDYDTDTAILYINRYGYQGGTTRYRKTVIGDGKSNTIVSVNPGQGNVVTNANTENYGDQVNYGNTAGIVRSSTDATAPEIYLKKARGSVGAQTAIISGDGLGAINGYGYVNGAMRQLAACEFVATAAPSGNNAETAIKFTTNNGTALAERARISGAGNVGIGTDTPLSKLHVKANAIVSNATITPSTGAAIDSIQIGGGGCISSNNNGPGSLEISNNAYVDGTNTSRHQIGSQKQSNIRLDDDGVKIQTGASGSAGSVITTTPKLIIENDGDIVVSKTSGIGIKVDTTAPTFGWKDLIGTINTRPSPGANLPAYNAYGSTNIYAYQFTSGSVKEAFVELHVPHDYALGTDMLIHAHWSQTTVDTGGAAGVPGNVKWYFNVMYAKGHGTAGGAARGAFGTQITTSVVQQGSTTQYGHMVAEVQLSAASPSASQIDSDDLEPDGVILCRIYRDDTDVADTLNQAPFLHYVDIHYQSTQLATKNKAPNFYS
jgi:hypothetical protein